MLVYLHGLNSSSRSYKADRLRSALKPRIVVAPNYPAHRPSDAIGCLSAYFAMLRSAGPATAPTVLGSSMGGFYGQYLARRFRFAHLYMINPALTPWTLFTEHSGRDLTAADGERYLVTRTLIDATRPFGIDRPCDGTPTTLFLERGDQVIDCGIAEHLYAGCARLMVWDGGDHAFRHLDDAIEVLRRDLDEGTGFGSRTAAEAR